MANPRIASVVTVGFLWASTSVIAGENKWTTSGPDVERRTVRTLTIDPQDHLTLYVGTVTGEVHRTTDAGETWELLVADLPVPPLSSFNSYGPRVAVDPTDSRRLYASTIGGVYRSTDGGLSWLPANTGLPVEAEVGEVVVDPINPSTVYAAVTSAGVFKSTDGAETWQSAAQGFEDYAASGLTIHPTEPATLYARAFRFFDSTWFRTTDAGATWRPLPDGPPSTTTSLLSNLVIAPSDTDVLYASQVRGIYRSVDAGDSWDLARSIVTDGRIAVDPTDASILYLGIRQTVLRLSEGGARSADLHRGLPIVPGVYDLVVDPLIPNRVYAAADEGVYRIDQTPDVCGNFTIEDDEECDRGDQNGAEGSCCSASCQVEPGVCLPCQRCLTGVGCSGPECTPTPTTTGAAPTSTETPMPSPTAIPCAGDCNLDRAATVDELVVMVNIALGERQVTDCLAGDIDGDSQITVDEIIATVQSALTGCV